MSALAEHLMALPDSGWSVWRWTCLRGAGFPASLVQRLAASEAAEAADALFAAQAEAERAREAAVEALTTALRAAHGGGDGDGAALKKLARNVRKGGLPPEGVTEAAPEMRALRGAAERLTAAEARFRAAFDAARASVVQAVRELAREPRLREAITWQNRAVIRYGLDHVADSSPAGSDGGNTSRAVRRHEELVASYLQRYCTKNDSIGFFGPVGWARFETSGPTVVARPGAELIASRNVYFEQWGIDALARKLADDARLEPWMMPRRFPFVRLAGTTAASPVNGRHELTPAQALVLAACDGKATAQDLAAQLVRLHPDLLEGSSAVFEQLRRLREAQLLAWTFEVPFEWHPEAVLRRLLERIDDEALRAEALRPLDELEGARRRVAESTGTADALATRLEELEAVFTRVTGLAPTRHAGATYAARQLVFEDCRRDVEMTIGPQLLAGLSPALTLVLASARWLTHEIGQAYRAKFRALYEDMARRAGAPAVSFSDLWLRAQRLLFGAKDNPIKAVAADLQARWLRVLALPDGARAVQLTSSELAERAGEAFAAPGPGWTGARYQCPDVMIAAPSVEAICRGDYLLVLGELHVATNTSDATVFLAQHPHPQDLIDAFARDVPEPVVIPVNSKDWPKMTARTQRALVSPSTLFLESGFDPARGSRDNVLTSGALVVEDIDGKLCVRTPEGMTIPLMNLFAEVLSSQIVSEFRILPRADHTPRVTIDKLVICRESWSFSPASMAFADEPDDMGRFLDARRWARKHGIPRFAYVRSPLETKPVFVDFDAPAFVNILAKLVRHAKKQVGVEQPITMSEMLPTLDQTWLEDAAGERYTSELRLVCVDGAR